MPKRRKPPVKEVRWAIYSEETGKLVANELFGTRNSAKYDCQFFHESYPVRVELRMVENKGGRK